MASIRGRDTRPERLLRSELSRQGIRYRLQPKDVIGRPDLVFRRAKVAVFCDGDFWHGRNWDASPGHPEFKSRREFWIPKIESNIRRDILVNAALTREGWLVLRIWESELEDDVVSAAGRVKAAIRARLSEAVGPHAAGSGSKRR